MDNEPSIDRGLLIPILVGGFSVFGIVIVLLAGRLSASRALVPTVQTETPFRYIFLGTEPGILTESPEAIGTELLTENPFASSTPIPLGTIPGLVTPTLRTPVPSTPNNTAPAFPPTNNNPPPGNLTSPANTALPTSTSASGPPLNAGTYDDVDSHLAYDGPWANQTGVAGAYQNTLHVSQAIGSSLTFRFIGSQLRLFYQGGSSLGVMTIAIDGQNSTLNQASGSEWPSNSFPNGTHSVLITHTSGGPVNLDYVIVPEVASTATPTVTPTRTPRP